MNKTNKNLPRSLEGVIHISHKGDGKVRIERSDDFVKIEHSFLRTALNGDRVTIALHPHRKGEEETGEVTSIIRRANRGFAGVLEKENATYFLAPSDLKMYADIVIPEGELNGAKIGEKVYAEITEWKDQKKAPIGKILKVLGKPMEHNAEMEAIALEKGFSEDFPASVKEEALAIKSRGIKKEDEAGRRDMRGITTFTIDPSDAKDFDDAISFSKISNDMYEIGVHIADVSHYLRPKSHLDEEAVQRGTSVYLVDRTIPMLPEELSNDLCSLNPNVDRLTFSAVFEMDKHGNVRSEWFGRTIINSDKRFTYENAQEILDKKKGVYFEELNTLNSIAKELLKKRFNDGAISLEQEEVKFVLDANGTPTSVYTKERKDTHKLIEEFMLLANRKVAEYMSPKKHGGVFVYRIHDEPNKDKMNDLAFFLRRLGYKVKMKDGIIPAEEINKLVEKLENHPLRDTVHSAIIRTMAKAIYSTKNIGHFGLGFKHYTHFTSPIRRYPDVMVHRLLAEKIAGKPVPKERWYEYEEICQEASLREKEAADAERASIKYKQVEYMTTRIGKSFTGIITGVTEWGLYVEDKETKCEGMVRMRSLQNDFYIFDKKHMSIFGKRTKKRYTLGDTVKFKVVDADMNKKNIDYELL